MKRIMCFALVTILLIAGMPSTALAAEEVSYVLSENTTTPVTLYPGVEYSFSFTPTTSGWYTFTAQNQSNTDTIIMLCPRQGLDSDFVYFLLKESGSSGYFYADKEYEFYIFCRDWKSDSWEADVQVSKSSFPELQEGQPTTFSSVNWRWDYENGDFVRFIPSHTGTYEISCGASGQPPAAVFLAIFDATGSIIEYESLYVDEDYATPAYKYTAILDANTSYYLYYGAVDNDSSKNSLPCTITATFMEKQTMPDPEPTEPSPSDTTPSETIPAEEKTCRLDELTTIDYLAFAVLAYEDKPTADTTIEAMLESQWSKVWSNDITYSELFENIKGWRYAKTGIANNASGFYAMAFVNDHNEYVITYRGSIGLDTITDDPDAWWADWIENNGEMLLNGNASQVWLAMKFYDVVKENNPAAIAITGHSLGGALGDIVSAYSGDKAITFNAAPFLDIAYAYHAIRMSSAFEGVDKWNFYDTINNKDIVGMIDSTLKPALVCTDQGLADNAHSLESFVYKDASGNLQLISGTKYTVGKTTWVMPEASISDLKQFLTTGNYIDFGTSKDDTFYGLYGAQTLLDSVVEFFSGVYSRVSFGGNGEDEIVGGLWADILVGGNGTDYLAGNTGDDTYIYNKGDGMDYIIDRAGDDRLLLRGFADSDTIHVESLKDSDYIRIYCNNEIIVNIDKTCRDKWNLDNFLIEVQKDETITKEYLDSSLFSPKNYIRRIIIACPTDVQILNETGEIVYTLDCSKEGAYYTKYGDFYVFEEDNGELGKILDLVDGYSVQIVGTDDGTMGIAVSEIGNEEDIFTLTDVPVTSSFVASYEDTDGEYYLHIDADGDGAVEQIMELLNVNTSESPSENSAIHFEVNGGTEIADITAINGKVISRPTDPTKDGKYFAGWFKDIDCTEEWNFETDTVSGNMTLYAKWSDATVDDADIEQPTEDNGFNYLWLLTIIPILLIIVFLIKKRPKEKH